MAPAASDDGSAGPTARPAPRHSGGRDAAAPGAGAEGTTSRSGRPDGGRSADAAAGRGPAAGDADPALSRPGKERPEIAVVPFPRRVPYRQGLELQRRLARARINGGLRRDLLLLMEHDPVLTLGRGARDGHLRADPARLEERGVDAVEIERGGDVTYHGPGQTVGYPILDLHGHRKDLHWYLRAVEEALIRALGRLGLPAFRVPEHTGVWVGERPAPEPEGGRPAGADGEAGSPEASPEVRAASAEAEAPDTGAAAILQGRVRKIASIGVHVSRWVTWHGFALNVTEEPMENFRLIVPCGIQGVRMTSLEGEGVAAGRSRVREALAAGFASVFDARVVRRRGPGEAPAGGGAG